MNTQSEIDRDNLKRLEEMRRVMLETSEAAVIRSIAMPMIDREIKMKRNAVMGAK